MRPNAVTVDIGGMPIALRCADTSYAAELARRFDGFLAAGRAPVLDFDIELFDPGDVDPDAEVRVTHDGPLWRITRADCEAVADLAAHRGTIRQPRYPYATDTVLRILHSVLLARTGGLLLHASSAVVGGRAFVFFGRSGAGKSTMVDMAPASATVLSEEISYVRRRDGVYEACGTPFTGELNRKGENVAAPLAGLFHLVQAGENRIVPMTGVDAARTLLQSILCFEGDACLTRDVFDAACELVTRVPVATMRFERHPRVWELFA